MNVPPPPVGTRIVPAVVFRNITPNLCVFALADRGVVVPPGQQTLTAASR
jgi:hypothetical protein